MALFLKMDKVLEPVGIYLVDQSEWKILEKTDYLNRISELHQFTGKAQQILIEPKENGSLNRVWAGTSFSNLDPRNWIVLSAKLAETLPNGSYEFHNLPDDRLFDAMLGWGLATYGFNNYKKDAKETKECQLVVPDHTPITRTNNILESAFLAKDLINTPACDLSPKSLVNHVKHLAEEFNAAINVIEGGNLLLENFPAIFAVGKGSEHPPALIELNWGKEDHPKVTLVGKGVVFDSGGLNLKPASGMRHMKKDMGGAAVSIGLARLIMSQKLPVRLKLLVPTVENSPGWKAYHPGDVIKTRKGIHVEIGNTDAEGRMILCDALALAMEDEPDLLLDFATLTGSARVALGEDLPACYTPDNDLFSDLERASETIRDPLWRMPLWEPYSKLLKSDVADMENVASTPLGGSITASLFLWEFVKPFSNWIHFDMFGWRNTAMPGFPKGGEASALRAVFQLLENRYHS